MSRYFALPYYIARYTYIQKWSLTLNHGTTFSLAPTIVHYYIYSRSIDQRISGMIGYEFIILYTLMYMYSTFKI